MPEGSAVVAPAGTGSGAALHVDTTAKWFLLSSISYFFIVGIIALTIAAKFCWPELLGTVPYLSYGRLRPLHVNGMLFGWLLAADMGLSYYIVPRLCGVKLWSEKLGVATAALWNVIVLGAVFSLMAGYNQGFEYAELPLPLDVLVVIAWVMYGINIFATIARRKYQQMYVTLWYTMGTILWTAFVYITGNFAVEFTTGTNQANLNWMYVHNAVNLTLLPRELVGLIGPNGAGKTTVFNLLTGVYRPTRGEILFHKRPMTGHKPHRISRAGIARTFQNIRLFANLSVLDNVMIAQHAHHRQGIPAAILRTPPFFEEEARSRQVAHELLALFHLDRVASEQASSLSYGDQRRLEIARALATRPRLLLLDEPAAGMNPTEKRELMDLIRRLRDQFNLTILLIEHDMKVVMGVCQRILVLDYGKTIAGGTPEEIRKNPAVITAYLGASAKQG